MTSLLDHLIEPFRLGLMQRALIQVVVVSAVGGAVGCFVVIRGLSFTGESLAHTVLPGVVAAYAIGISLLLGAAALAAVTVAISLLARRDRRITEDTAMGVAFAGLFPLGVILLALQSNPTRSLSDFLFGDVLANSRADVDRHRLDLAASSWPGWCCSTVRRSRARSIARTPRASATGRG